MNYKELLEQYKANQLDEDKKQLLEQEIEKQSAINDYLFEAEEMELERLGAGEIPANSENSESKLATVKDDNTGFYNDRNEEKLVKYIEKSIRHSFIKLGVIVGVIVLALALIIIYGIPKLQESIYYNPQAKVGTHTKKIDVDMATFTELFMPGRYRCDVGVSSNGGSSYNISIAQTASYSGNFYDFGGVINKGKLLLYNDNLFKPMPMNYWYNGVACLTGMEHVTFGSKEASFKALDSLEPTTKYVAYVTLNKVMNYRDFITLVKRNAVAVNWCKLCFNRYDAENDKMYFDGNIGFIPYNVGAFDFEYNEEKYPYLSLADATAELYITEEVMTSHVISMMEYMIDQKQFLNMLDWSDVTESLRKYVADIEKNGLNIYGFTMIGTKEDICALQDIEEVEYIETRQVQYE